MSWLIFLVLSLVWGSNFILMHRVAVVFSPISMGFWRLMLGSAVLFLWWSVTERRWFKMRDFPHVVLVALVGNAIPFTLLPLVISKGFGHSFFAVVVAFVPLVTIAASIVLLGIWPSRRQWIGVLGGFAGLAVLLWDGKLRGMSPGTLAMAVTVPVSYGVSNTYIRWKLAQAPVLLMSAVFFLLGGLMLIPMAWVWDAQPLWRLPTVENHMIPIASLVWLGAIGTGLAGAAFVHLIQVRGPLFAGLVTYLVPIVGLGWGAYDHETISFRQVAAMVMVVAMIALAQSQAGSARIPMSQSVPKRD